MAARLFAFDEIDHGSAFDIVYGFDAMPAKPDAYEVLAGFQEDFAEEKARSRFLAGPQTEEFAFLRRIGVNQAITGGVIENEGKITAGKIGVAFQVDLDA